MEFLLHFCFQLVKIGILSLFYLGIVLILLRLVPFRQQLFSQRIHANKRFRVKTWGIVYLLLFFWQFSHWGDRGLGDYARIPLRHSREIEQINSSGMYIRPIGHEGETLGIAYYSTSTEYCYGKITNGDQYFIWNLASNEIEKFKLQSYYLRALQKRRLETTPTNWSFEEGYRRYWKGWRFWLLP